MKKQTPKIIFLKDLIAQLSDTLKTKVPNKELSQFEYGKIAQNTFIIDYLNQLLDYEINQQNE